MCLFLLVTYKTTRVYKHTRKIYGAFLGNCGGGITKIEPLRQTDFGVCKVYIFCFEFELIKFTAGLKIA